MNEGIEVIQPDKLSQLLDVETNGCILNDYRGGKLQLSYSKQGMFLDVSYQFGDQQTPTKCIKSQRYAKLFYQGFFGLTSMNSIDQKPNDIDLKAIEFFNLNTNYYQDTKNIELRDYFRRHLLQEDEDLTNGKEATQRLATTAKDLLRIKRIVADIEQKVIQNDLSRVLLDDTLEETIYKIYE